MDNDEIDIAPLLATTTLSIDVGMLRDNVSIVRKAVGEEIAIIAVVKSDGYGLGQVRIAQELLSSGVASIGVATSIDALNLRKAEPSAVLMLIYPVLAQDYTLLVRADIEITVTTLEQAFALDAIAKKQKKIARVHLQVETGMHHYGVETKNLVEVASFISESSSLIFAGIATHFASAGADSAMTIKQYDNFMDALTLLSRRSIFPESIHCANSAALDVLPESWSLSGFRRLMPNATVAVRIGSILYGLYHPLNSVLKTSMIATRLETHIVEVKFVKKGEAIGYFGSYVATSDIRIGIVPLGWGSNGFFAKNGHVLIDGNKVQVIGSIGANTCAIDISHIAEADVGQIVSALDTTAGSRGIGLEELGEQQSMFTSRLLLSLGVSSYRTYIDLRRKA